MVPLLPQRTSRPSPVRMRQLPGACRPSKAAGTVQAAYFSKYNENAEKRFNDKCENG
jgi:hypothetical protein